MVVLLHFNKADTPSDTPLATIPPSIIPISYCPNIVIYNEQHHKIQLLELTCPFNTTEHLQAARERKSSKPEYQLLISELNHLGYGTLYLTIEIGCLGHFLTPSIRALQAAIEQPVAACKSILSRAAQKSISSSPYF